MRHTSNVYDVCVSASNFGGYTVMKSLEIRREATGTNCEVKVAVHSDKPAKSFICRTMNKA